MAASFKPFESMPEVIRLKPSNFWLKRKDRFWPVKGSGHVRHAIAKLRKEGIRIKPGWRVASDPYQKDYLYERARKWVPEHPVWRGVRLKYRARWPHLYEPVNFVRDRSGQSYYRVLWEMSRV
jgi:hypothetical protein